MGQDLEATGGYYYSEPRVRPGVVGAKLGIRGAEWPLIVLVALAVAVPTALAPAYALAAAAVRWCSASSSSTRRRC